MRVNPMLLVGSSLTLLAVVVGDVVVTGGSWVSDVAGAGIWMLFGASFGMKIRLHDDWDDYRARVIACADDPARTARAFDYLDTISLAEKKQIAEWMTTHDEDDIDDAPPSVRRYLQAYGYLP